MIVGKDKDIECELMLGNTRLGSNPPQSRRAAGVEFSGERFVYPKLVDFAASLSEGFGSL
jgi:hypothetical protein